MGIMVTKDNQERDELTRRINADLREKINKTQKVSDGKEDPDSTQPLRRPGGRCGRQKHIGASGRCFADDP